MREDVVDRAAHLLLGLVHVHGHHLLLGLVRLVRRLAVEQVGGQRDEALAGKAVADAADVVVQTPPLLQDDEPGALVIGFRQVTGGAAPVGLELDVWHLYSSSCWLSDSSSASAQPTATPTIIPMRASSARRVRMAVSRSSSSSAVAALRTCSSCASP